jgi:hypothetical protein
MKENSFIKDEKGQNMLRSIKYEEKGSFSSLSQNIFICSCLLDTKQNSSINTIRNTQSKLLSKLSNFF